jgi:DNA replication protein DnaC
MGNKNEIQYADPIEEKKEYTDKTQWTNVGDNTYVAVGKTEHTIKSGVYVAVNYKRDMGALKEISLNFDKLIHFEDYECKINSILKEVENFWNSSDIYKEYGFLHKRGIMLHGQAGSGKTSILYMIIEDIVKRGGIAILCENPFNLSLVVQDLRKIEPNRKIVCIFEDIDTIIKHYEESDLLSFLDGEIQVNNILNIGTTNYPESLDKRIISRPRRFDRLEKIDLPSKSIRAEYFTKKLGVDEGIDEWVDVSEGFTFAAMTDLVIGVKCLGNPLEDYAKRLNKNLKGNLASSDYKEKSGFVMKEEV